MGTEMLVNGVQQEFRFLHSQGNMANIKVLHVVTALHVLVNIALASAAKCLDSVELIFLHNCGLAALDDWNSFPRVDLIGRDGVTIQISDAFNLVDFPVKFNFMTLHDFLYCSASITKPCINTGGLDTNLGGFLDSFDKGIVLVIEGQCPGAVDDPALDVGPKVHLDDIVKLQDRVVPRVGRVVGGHVVPAAPGGEGEPSLQPTLVDQRPPRELTAEELEAKLAREEEEKQMTLDEWKKLQAKKEGPKFNLRKAGEGSDVDPKWKKATIYKKENEDEEEEEEAVVYLQRSTRQKKLDINFTFADQGGR